jgi:hypothetical protein
VARSNSREWMDDDVPDVAPTLPTVKVPAMQLLLVSCAPNSTDIPFFLRCTDSCRNSLLRTSHMLPLYLL